jgi:hypothetical protein
VSADRSRYLAVLLVTRVAGLFGRLLVDDYEMAFLHFFPPCRVGVAAITAVTSDCFVTSGNSADEKADD